MAAGLLAVIFLGASFQAEAYRADVQSQRLSERYASAMAPALESGDWDSATQILETLTGGRFAVVDPDGAFMLGDRGLVSMRGLYRADVPGSDGTVIAELRTVQLRKFESVLSPQAIVVLVIIALGTAYAVGRVYTEFVLNGLSDVYRTLGDLNGADGAVTWSKVTVTEFQQLRTHMRRRLREDRRLRERLEVAAYRNPATDRPNLLAFQKAVEQALLNADIHSPVTVVCMDLGKFHARTEDKGIDDPAPLIAAALARVEAEISELGRQGILEDKKCFLAHLQDDEFALMLPPGAGVDIALQLGRNLRRAFTSPFHAQNRWITLGISGGIVVAPENGSEVGVLVQRATSARRSLKNDKKSGFAVFQARIDELGGQRALSEGDLRAALEADQFVPAFQPKINFKSGRIGGCEALARWTREDGTTVSPGDFIPLAEETGLILEIGDTILRKACREAALWVQKGWRVPVAVNVSAAQLDDPLFCDRVLDAISDGGLPPALLELEITESMAIRDPNHVEAVLLPLRKMGVRLAIDDFGTGHSNLAILSRLNFDVFKIDKSYISQLTLEPSAPALVEMILAMAHSLGHETVAEGIETAEQAAFLRARGCVFAQGFYYCRPLAAGAFRERLATWNPDLLVEGILKAS